MRKKSQVKKSDSRKVPQHCTATTDKLTRMLDENKARVEMLTREITMGS